MFSDLRHANFTRQTKERHKGKYFFTALHINNQSTVASEHFQRDDCLFTEPPNEALWIIQKLKKCLLNADDQNCCVYNRDVLPSQAFKSFAVNPSQVSNQTGKINIPKSHGKSFCWS